MRRQDIQAIPQIANLQKVLRVLSRVQGGAPRAVAAALRNPAAVQVLTCIHHARKLPAVLRAAGPVASAIMRHARQAAPAVIGLPRARPGP